MVEDKVLCPIGIRRMKDKFGFHKVRVYDGLEALQFIIRFRIAEQKRKQDTVYLTSGLEGIGKSMFNLWAVQIYGEETGKKIDISHVTRCLDEMFIKIYELRNEPSIVCLDEGAELDGTNSNTKHVKSIKKKFTNMRKKSQIIFLCFVNPLRIATYFREDRVRGLFFVVRQGEVWFYSNTQDNPHLASIIDSWSKEHEGKSLKFLKNYAPDMILRGIPDYNGELRREYEERKDENIDEVLLEGIKIDKAGVEIESEYANIREAASILGLTDASVKLAIHKGIFQTVKIRNKIHIKKQDLLAYKNKGLGTVKNSMGVEEIILV